MSHFATSGVGSGRGHPSSEVIEILDTDDDMPARHAKLNHVTNEQILSQTEIATRLFGDGQPHLPIQFNESIETEKKVLNERHHPLPGSPSKIAIVSVTRCSPEKCMSQIDEEINRVNQIDISIYIRWVQAVECILCCGLFHNQKSFQNHFSEKHPDALTSVEGSGELRQPFSKDLQPITGFRHDPKEPGILQKPGGNTHKPVQSSANTLETLQNGELNSNQCLCNVSLHNEPFTKLKQESREERTLGKLYVQSLDTSAWENTNAQQSNNTLIISPITSGNGELNSVSIAHDTNEQGSAETLQTDGRFACEKCGSSYAFERGLDRHVKRAHRSFYKEYKLKQKNSVASQKRIPCEKCSNTYAYEKDLRGHVKKKHGKTENKNNENIYGINDICLERPDIAVHSSSEKLSQNLSEDRQLESTNLELIIEKQSVPGGKKSNSEADDRLETLVPNISERSELDNTNSELTNLFEFLCDTNEQQNIPSGDENVYEVDDPLDSDYDPATDVNPDFPVSRENQGEDGGENIMNEYDESGNVQKHFSCEECGKTFSLMSSLKRHVKAKHLNLESVGELSEKVSKEIICPKCSESFHTMFYLRRHLKTKHSDSETKPTCNICNQSFTYSHYFSRHVRKRHTKITASRQNKKTETKIECLVCNNVFGFNKYFLRHFNRVHQNPKPFKCKRCHKTFSEESKRQEHLKDGVCIIPVSQQTKDNEGTEPKCCDICLDTFDNAKCLQLHMSNAHSDRIECKCGKQFNRKDYFKHIECCTEQLNGTEKPAEERQIEEKHFKGDKITQNESQAEKSTVADERDFKCKLCEEKVNSPFHAFMHSKNKPFVCSTCGYSAFKRCRVAKHVRGMSCCIHATEKPFVQETESVCDSCSVAFSDINAFMAHWKNEHTWCLNQYIKCKFCDNSYKRECLRSHIKNAHIRGYVCDVCGKSYGTGSRLKKHLRTHKSPSLPCPKCQKMLSDEKSLRRHLKDIHENKDSCIFCDECGKALKGKESLKNHKARFHSNKGDREGVQCLICGKIFISQAQLNNHLATHSTTRDFHCSKCPKSFKTKVSLYKHMESHSNERKYKCNLCEAAFKLKHHLDAHSVKHTGIRSFVCSFCEKAFGRKQILDTHILSHTGERPFACENCSKTFIRQTDLNKHMRLEHDSKPSGQGFKVL